MHVTDCVMKASHENFESPTSSVEEYQDWLLRRSPRQLRSLYIQGEAVFTLWRTKTSSKSLDNILGLRRKARKVNRSRASLWAVAGDIPSA